MSIQCQEEVSPSKRSYNGSKERPIPYTHPDEISHQCKFHAQYLIKSINLYVCALHASGMNKKDLTKLKQKR